MVHKFSEGDIERDINESYLGTLRQQGYIVSYLIDRNKEVYIITKEEKGRFLFGCYTSHGWFDGKKFGANESWFDSISTQEQGDDCSVLFDKDDESTLFGLVGRDLISTEKLNPMDVIESILSQKERILN